MSIYLVLDLSDLNESASTFKNWYNKAESLDFISNQELYQPGAYETSQLRSIKTNLQSLTRLPANINLNYLRDLSNSDFIDAVSYGVSILSSSPYLTRVGNTTFHKTLPILSNMQGCIVKIIDNKPVVLYYLNEYDWAEIPVNNLNNATVGYSNTIELTFITNNNVTTCENDIFSTARYEGCNFYVQEDTDVTQYAGTITSIDTETRTATVTTDTTYNGTYNIIMGAVLNGYDGEVMVEIPEFWIKENNNEIRISTMKIDDTWEHQPKTYISAYHDTVLISVPENMGYLSTLPLTSAISVCNNKEYCRGGSNDKNYDKYLSTDKYRTMLGKPRTNLNRSDMRRFARLAGKEVLNYNLYKNIYWLYVIEYANLNSLDTYINKMDKNGYKQGGLGNGVTNLEWLYVRYYNNCTPIVPNGITNGSGNRTEIVTEKIKLPTTEVVGSDTKEYTIKIPRWRGIENPFGDINTMLEGILVSPETIMKYKTLVYPTYVTTNPDDYSDSDYTKMLIKGLSTNSSLYISTVQISNDGYYNNTDIIPREANSISSKLYFCDGATMGPTVLSTVRVGGNSYAGDRAGLLCWDCTLAADLGAYDTGFRTVCVAE